VSLFDIYADYLDTLRIEKERDPKRLFVTDVGKCLRQVALRMVGAERKQPGPQDYMMWDLAEYIEETLMHALDARGELIEYQAPLDIADRENWGGRLDIVRVVDDHAQIVEVKTVRSNAFNFDDRPKQDHIYQTTIYDHYYDYVAVWTRHIDPVVWYADRGGSNPPEEYVITPDFEPVGYLMDELEAVRRSLPALPDLLPKVLKLTNYKKVLKCVPDWRCSYCDYRDLSCHPDMGEEEWATEKESWRPKAKADLGKLYTWAEAQNHSGVLSVLL